MAVSKSNPVPYTTPSAILNIVDRYRQRGLQKPITAEVLSRAGVSEGLIPRTLQAMKTLDLIRDDENPTDTLEGLRIAPSNEYKDCLSDWIKAAYVEVFAFVDPANDNEEAVRDAFRSYTPIGQQSRMVTLFMGLCVAAGIVEKTQRESKPRIPRTTTKQRSLNKQRNTHMRDRGEGFSGNIPPALAGLLEQLPNEKGNWSQEQFDEFSATFNTVLKFCYPIKEINSGVDGNTSNE